MLNQNSILPIIKPHLSTGAYQRFIKTEYKILEDFTGDFLIGLYFNYWKLSYFGNEMSFVSKSGIYDYFDQEYSKLFEPPALRYVYCHSGMFLNVDKNSALVALKQSQDGLIALASN